MLQRGFTVIELIITITIMGILIVLAVVNVTSSQISARDDERIADVNAIASYLESYYTQGNDADGNGQYTSSYPYGNFTASETTIKAQLPDIDTKVLIAPGASSVTSTFVTATNATQTTGGVTPAPTISTYVYQPLSASGTLCLLDTTECRKYNLYYKLEKDNSIHMVTSKHQ